MQIKNISVVLPVHNEEENIGDVIKEIYDYFYPLADSFEIIAIDDGSVDKTEKILKNLILLYKQLKVVAHEKNKGYGAALVSGFTAAKNELILIMDADQQFHISEISKFIPFITSYDIVAGFRIKRQDPFYRCFLGKVFNFIINILFNINTKDINCGFKLFKTSLVQNMALRTKGALINTEIAVLAKRKQAKIKEVGITHYHRIYGYPSGANFRVIFKAIKETIQLKLLIKLE